jgi:S1-C subfamily serine protease
MLPALGFTQEKAMLYVNVALPDGHPCVNCDVDLEYSDGTVRHARTGTEGMCRVTSLAPGSYKVTAHIPFDGEYSKVVQISSDELKSLDLDAHDIATQHAPAAGSLSPQEVFARVKPSVFVVDVYTNDRPVALGSAVAIDSGTLVTNKHVIQAGESFRVRQGPQSWPAVAAGVDPAHDLGILTVEGLQAPSVLTRLSSTLAVGERVYAIGAPVGLELTLSEGLISGLRPLQGGGSIIQTTTPISHGSSGGGLFDAEGRLIGITAGSVEQGQNLNFAIPADVIIGIQSRLVPVSAVPPPPPPGRTQRVTPQPAQSFPQEFAAWHVTGSSFVSGQLAHDGTLTVSPGRVTWHEHGAHAHTEDDFSVSCDEILAAGHAGFLASADAYVRTRYRKYAFNLPVGGSVPHFLQVLSAACPGVRIK